MLVAGEPHSFSGHAGTIVGIAFSPDGSRVVTGAHRPQEFDRDAIVWDVPSGALRMRLHGNLVGVFSVAYAPDGSSIATGGGGAMAGNFWIYDNVIRFWNEDGQECGSIVDDLNVINALAFSPDSKYLLTGSKNLSLTSPSGDGACIRLWNASSKREIRRFGTYSSNVLGVAFSPDGKYAIAGSTGFVFGASAPWAPRTTSRKTKGDRSEQRERSILSRIVDAARRYAWQTRKRTETVDLYDRTLRIWEVETGKELDMFAYSERVKAVSFSPDGSLVLSAGSSVLVWDAKSGQRMQQIGGGEARFAHCAVFSPDGTHIAVGLGWRSDPGSPFENCFVILYELATGNEVGRWTHSYPVTALAFSPNGEAILAGGEQGEMHMWKIGSEFIGPSKSNPTAE
jgi:WD40 repeat protein